MLIGNKGRQRAISNLHVARVSTVPFFVITQLSAQLSALVRAGAKVSVVASDDEHSCALSTVGGVRFYPVNICRNISLIKDLKSLFQLIKLFRAQRFDIVHSTTPKAGLLCAIAGWIARVDVRLHTFTGQPWVTMSGLKQRLLKLCDRLIGMLNTHCYTDSISQREFLVSSGIVSPSKISVVGTGSLAGVDVKRFSRDRFSYHDRLALRTSLSIPQCSKVVLFVGRVTRDKGIQELLDAFSCVQSSLSDDVVLLVVGPFEPDAKLLFENFGDDIAHSNIRIIGFSDTPESYMAIADVLCLPSYREGFGTVVIEAAAMGVPTIGTNIYGLSDAIVDGETGLLVPVKDYRALADALHKVLDDDVLRTNMSISACSRAVKSFDSEYCSNLLIQEYEGFFR
ncbi:glycosyltransferase family 4 protein [Pseudomonas segetis]|uniref:Glycosyltransferase involved in cell wall bisynthesis n=1 Tax=Pseudomonas segetis TaxID=298908 RepID=A0A239A513_9PSED|nr:glycosyltransferase family 4 protein [Pseudomonas segetis]SNR90756.1 Glycosyltransferase involved in cell wall bisynthesis [Pseudomonas segetis]